MKRFVKHFHAWDSELPFAEQINEYAKNSNLTIVTIAPLYGNGIFVLFEKGSDNNAKEKE